MAINKLQWLKKNGNNNNDDNDKTTTYDNFKYKYDYQSKHTKNIQFILCIQCDDMYTIYIHGSSIFVFILNIQGFTIHNKKNRTHTQTHLHTHTLSDISTRSNFEYIICSRLPSIIIWICSIHFLTSIQHTIDTKSALKFTLRSRVSHFWCTISDGSVVANVVFLFLIFSFQFSIIICKCMHVCCVGIGYPWQCFIVYVWE